jgi:hypothetical protein
MSSVILTYPQQTILLYEYEIEKLGGPSGFVLLLLNEEIYIEAWGHAFPCKCKVRTSVI